MIETAHPETIPPGGVTIRNGGDTVDLVVGLPDGIQAIVHMTEAEAIDLCTAMIATAMDVGAARKAPPTGEPITA